MKKLSCVCGGRRGILAELDLEILCNTIYRSENGRRRPGGGLPVIKHHHFSQSRRDLFENGELLAIVFNIAGKA